MLPIRFTFLICCLSVQLQSQHFTTKLEQQEKLGDEEKYTLVWSSAKNESVHQFMFNYYDKSGKLKYSQRLDTSLPVLKGLRTVNSITIRFPSRDTGFVYGHYISYGWVSFLYRTLNGGRSWESIFDYQFRTDLRSDQLLMFNSRQGLLIHAPENQNYFHCMVTEDAGKTWLPSTTIMGPGFRTECWPSLIIGITGETKNACRIKLEKPDGKSGSVKSEYHSTDRGKNFVPVN